MRYVNVDKLMRKIFDGDGDKPWFGSAGNDTKVLRFIDQFFYDDIDSKRLDKWIPVTERLPEEREWYLAVFKEKDTDFQLIPRVADYIGHGENKWRLIDEEGLVQEYRDLLECIAWQPLPEPYTEEVRE